MAEKPCPVCGGAGSRDRPDLAAVQITCTLCGWHYSAGAPAPRQARVPIGDCIVTTGCNSPRSCADAGECGSARVRAFLGAPPPDQLYDVASCEHCTRQELCRLHRRLADEATARANGTVVPSAPASGPNPLPPETPSPLRKNDDGPGADPMAPLRTFAARGLAAQKAVDQAMPRAAPASMDPIPFARLRAEADLLLALYLLEHPKARPSQLSAVELIAWAATKS